MMRRDLAPTSDFTNPHFQLRHWKVYSHRCKIIKMLHYFSCYSASGNSHLVEQLPYLFCKSDVASTQMKNTELEQLELEKFMKISLDLGREALEKGEVPVGCVFVLNGKVVAKAQNKTNETLNATMHAEIVALREMPPKLLRQTNQMDLFVSIEPCLMCAAALRQVGVRHVYFGAFNDKFGGCGSVFNLQKEQSPFPEYKVTYGILAEEAVYLLRQFYVRENQHAPEEKVRKKTNRVLKPVEKMDYSALK